MALLAWCHNLHSRFRNCNLEHWLRALLGLGAGSRERAGYALLANVGLRFGLLSEFVTLFVRFEIDKGLFWLGLAYLNVFGTAVAVPQ